jgi:hypothetical protein
VVKISVQLSITPCILAILSTMVVEVNGIFRRLRCQLRPCENLECLHPRKSHAFSQDFAGPPAGSGPRHALNSRVSRPGAFWKRSGCRQGRRTEMPETIDNPVLLIKSRRPTGKKSGATPTECTSSSETCAKVYLLVYVEVGFICLKPQETGWGRARRGPENSKQLVWI